MSMPSDRERMESTVTIVVALINETNGPKTAEECADAFKAVYRGITEALRDDDRNDRPEVAGGRRW